jgi:hypothetical protein
VFCAETQEEQNDWLTLIEFVVIRIQNKPPPSGPIVVKVVMPEQEISRLLKLEASSSYETARSMIFPKFGIANSTKHSLWVKKTNKWLEEECKRLKAPMGYFVKAQVEYLQSFFFVHSFLDEISFHSLN